MKRRNIAILSTLGAITIFIGGTSVGAAAFSQSTEDAQVTTNNINRMMEYNDKLYSAYKNVKQELSNTKDALASLTTNNNEVKAQLDQAQQATHNLRDKTDNQAIPHFASHQPDASDVPAAADSSSANK
ncbi:hypothetical protein [Periweissella ghanensis]|uniref:Uncharacterized protein n=1 Tax=Periweissella ghanensis TaxID=467997 RepID=A0ABM8ZAA1_9LACO|nr:hypothetical protein [Periweissella ghanensis]MCM0601723.1 hypothetical protein [Periweissella ghanensis]CAH0418411.1 hypothetical protein WGH24286_00829 [Periweissella ghanensis]